MEITELKSQLFFNWIDDKELRTQLTKIVNQAKQKREQTQKSLSIILNISETKIKEIEKGTCKDFNAINNYINFYNQTLNL